MAVSLKFPRGEYGKKEVDALHTKVRRQNAVYRNYRESAEASREAPERERIKIYEKQAAGQDGAPRNLQGEVGCAEERACD